MQLRKGWRVDTTVLGVGPGQACFRSALGWVHRWAKDGPCFYGLTGQAHAAGKRGSVTAAMVAVEAAHRNAARRRRESKSHRRKAA